MAYIPQLEKLFFKHIYVHKFSKMFSTYKSEYILFLSAVPLQNLLFEQLLLLLQMLAINKKLHRSFKSNVFYKTSIQEHAPNKCLLVFTNPFQTYLDSNTDKRC